MQWYHDELNASDNAPSTLKAPSDKFTTQHSGQMDELALLSATLGGYHTGSTALAPSSLPVSLQFDIVKHLKDRYGYDVHRQPSWTPNLHGEKVCDVVMAKGRILFESTDHHILLAPAIKNFCNVLANEKI